ncbi:DNA ligase D [Rhodobacteraceae bacterium 2CG4]|uniref:DNA ligase (ATP) n=1 Tax=Halovulum marinum TaxID=2662447 RepID=A0A6L5Z092_9RHOB|nr:DNA ligase D [Halovulum marinum]MSU89515.1 DNA ligase D [Halovulum marinum]
MSRLEEYNRRRDFRATPEPKGRAGRGRRRGLGYSIQKHHARRLHFDLRLEWDGALLSWAVTRGPSTDPADKRLAVRTEDHPLDYRTFEGEIPAGHYGAGRVELWDEGQWVPEGDVDAGLAEGKLKFALKGDRLTGGWTLVRMRPKNGESRENWLLIKERDAEATGALDAADERGAPPAGFDLKTPAFRPLQLARLVDAAPGGDDWLHETKFDGYRCLAALGRDGVRLYTRSGKDWTDRFAGLPEAFARLDCRNALIDGEVVSARGGEGSTFSALQQDLEAGRKVRFAAFDLLELDGKPLVKRPLSERKPALAALLAGQPKAGAVFLSEHVVGRGPSVFAAIAKAGGEGIVSKRLDAPYTGRRSGAWLKIKATRRQEFVIGGLTPSQAQGRPFASVLIGAWEGDRLVYRGRVGAGFSDADLERVAARVRRRKTSPFDDAVPRSVARGAQWVTPELVAEIDFAELTDGGAVRHGTFRGLRQDKPAKEVRMETAAELTLRGVKISSAERTVFPEAGCTKGDLARYYDAAAERLLQTAAARPVSLLRCPEGIDGECFFQKHAGKGFPEAIGRVGIEERSGKTAEYMMLDSPGALVAAAQVGAIEFHLWGARADRLDRPDRLVFDLDPDEGLQFAAVRDAAAELRDFLAGIGVETAPMVTGGKGVHVIAHLRRTSGWDTIKGFSHTVAQHFADAQPDRFVATMSKARRKGRIFIDWLRNERGATAIAPWSVRARPGAPVAVPVSWDELAKLTSANGFDMGAARARLSRHCPLQALGAQSVGTQVVERLERAIRR